MKPPKKSPCGSCPYRQDAPTGLWHYEEYIKLPEYDRPMPEQPQGVFGCHQDDGHLCAGWVGTHDMKRNLAVRLNWLTGHMTDEEFLQVLGYETKTPLFATGREACNHGLQDYDAPPERTERVKKKLKKNPKNCRGHRGPESERDMSHSVVTVVIRNAANTQEAEAMLDALLDPFDENMEMEPYPNWCDADDVEHVSRFYREHPEYCPGSDEHSLDQGGPVKPFDEYVTEGNLEAWNEWTRQAIGAYHGNGRDTGIYDAEEDRFGYLSTYNPDSRWDWWALGGRWHGFFQLKPKVEVGSEPMPAWRSKLIESTAGFGMDAVEGAQNIPNFDGTQAALLGNSGVGGDDPSENFEARADLARKGDIDFDLMRALAGQRAEAEYDKFEEATKGLPIPDPWDDVLKRTFFDNDTDPDETFEGYVMSKAEKQVSGELVEGSTGSFVDPLTGQKPAPPNDDEEQQAWVEHRREIAQQARVIYNDQPFIKALAEANLNSFFGDPLQDWCVNEGGRATYVERAIDKAGASLAVLIDGVWHERGQMGWFGMASNEKDPGDWHAQQRRIIDSLPDDVYLAAVDVHI